MSGEIIAILAVGVALAGLILTSNRGLRKDCSKDCARPSAGGSRPARDERSMNLCRYFLPLLVVLLLSGPLSAQETDEDGQFYLNFSGSAIFPYAPKVQSVGLGGPGNNFEVGGGFTAAFGYAFKEGFSTEIEWGHQRVGIGNKLPFGNLPQTNFGGLIWTGSESSEGFEIPSPPSITIESNGEIKTQSLMGNVYYRYPKWRVSPYAGFGLGAFFHDRTVTSTISFEPFPPLPDEFFLGFPGGPLTGTYEDSRFAYQIMGGLSVRVYKRVEFRFGYRFRSSRGEPIDADQIEAGVRFRF